MQKSNTNFITCFKNLVLNTPIIPFFKYFGISSVRKHTVEVLDLAKISTGTMNVGHWNCLVNIIKTYVRKSE